MLTFSQWLAANKYDEANLTPEMRKHLEAAWKFETQPAPIPEKKPETVDDKLAAYEAEAARKDFIREACEQWAKENQYAGAEKLKQLRELQQIALDDQKMTADNFRYQMLRFDKTIGVMVTTPRQEEASAEVIEAALCMTCGVKADKQFNERTLEAAHRRFRGGLTLGGLVAMFSRSAGYRGDYGGEANLRSQMRAIKHSQMHGDMMASSGSGLSTLSIAGILSNLANKALAPQFLYGEQSWRQIAKIRTANDFKLMSTYRMTGNNAFIKVPPGGEIKHGTLSDLTYTNQVETYGIMLGIDRRDFINDDLGALTGRAAEIGIGAIEGFNVVFWTEWLDDSTFFPTDKSLLNYDDGATDSVLSLAGLDNAENLFALQTKPSGTPLGATPRILLVPRALKNTALNLMAPAVTAAAQSTATQTLANVYSGRYDVVDSVYLQSSAITGYSSTAWYLLMDPMFMAAIEVAFLFGRDTPIVEEAELDFDRLGMSMRAYWDFGVNKQEYRAGQKLKGAA